MVFQTWKQNLYSGAAQKWRGNNELNHIYTSTGSNSSQASQNVLLLLAQLHNCFVTWYLIQPTNLPASVEI